MERVRKKKITWEKSMTEVYKSVEDYANVKKQPKTEPKIVCEEICQVCGEKRQMAFLSRNTMAHCRNCNERTACKVIKLS